MPQSQLAIHALPEELLQALFPHVSQMRLHVSCITFPPFSVTQISAENMAQTVVDGSCRSLLLTEIQPRLTVQTMGELTEANPDGLYIDVGRLSGCGLQQSGLSFSTSKISTSKKWKRILDGVKRSSNRGAIAVNPDSGAISQLKQHLFTRGARDLEMQGVRMLPVAGGCIIKFSV